jgi:hypothetical protein
MRVGVWFYGVATVVTGILDLIWGQFEASHQPIQSLGHFPGESVLAYLAGIWLMVAGFSVLWRRTARMGAAGAAIIYLIFASFWLPRFYAMALVFGFRIGVVIFGLGGLAAQILLAAPAAIVFAESAPSEPIWRERAVITGRWMLGLPPIAFGLGHLINVHAYARFVPSWVPFGLVWVILTGIAFILAGTAIVTGIQDVLSAKLLTLMLLLFEAMVEIPPVFIRPRSQVAWGGAVYNLTAIGAYWLFAQFTLSRGPEDDTEIVSPTVPRVSVHAG